MSTTEKLQKLKLILNLQELRTQRESWTAPGLPDGIPRGALVELLGPSRTEWFLQFLKMHPELRTFWAERDQQILPTAIHQRGVDLRRITFGILGTDSVPSLRKVIQSQTYEVILAPNKFTEIKIFQAFQLFTEKANNTFFLLGQEKPSTAWPIALQLEIHQSDDESFQIEILKQRFGRTQ